MWVRHSAAEVSMPPSCSVSEVLKTSQSTFHSEIDTRNNSWARDKELWVLLLGNKVISLKKLNEKFQLNALAASQTEVNFAKIKGNRKLRVAHIKGVWILLDILKVQDQNSGPVSSLQNLVVKGHSSNFISTVFTKPQTSHYHKPEYTGKLTTSTTTKTDAHIK